MSRHVTPRRTNDLTQPLATLLLSTTKARGLKVRALAAAAEVDLASVQRALHGQASCEVCVAVADALGIDAPIAAQMWVRDRLAASSKSPQASAAKRIDRALSWQHAFKASGTNYRPAFTRLRLEHGVSVAKLAARLERTTRREGATKPRADEERAARSAIKKLSKAIELYERGALQLSDAELERWLEALSATARASIEIDALKERADEMATCDVLGDRTIPWVPIVGTPTPTRGGMFRGAPPGSRASFEYAEVQTWFSALSMEFLRFRVPPRMKAPPPMRVLAYPAPGYEIVVVVRGGGLFTLRASTRAARATSTWTEKDRDAPRGRRFTVGEDRTIEHRALTAGDVVVFPSHVGHGFEVTARGETLLAVINLHRSLDLSRRLKTRSSYVTGGATAAPSRRPAPRRST